MRACGHRGPRRASDGLDVVLPEGATRLDVDEERACQLTLAGVRAVPTGAAEPVDADASLTGCAHDRSILHRVTVAYLGLGANLGDRLSSLHRAIDELAAGVAVRATSSVYETAPWGRADQPAFLNCCAAIETDRGAHALLRLAKEIETTLGRMPSERWGPRAIDIDVLLYGDERIVTATLVVPHPRLTERAFALVPLAELAPDLPIPPARASVRAALAALARTPGDVRRVAPPIAPSSSRDAAR